MSKRQESDEYWVINLLENIFREHASRQHRFPFLLGDVGKNGRRVSLPVDAYFAQANVAVEFAEKQHSQSIAHFDKPDKMTISGVHRGEQRKLYDIRKVQTLKEEGIPLLVVSHSEFQCKTDGRLVRDLHADNAVLVKRVAALAEERKRVGHRISWGDPSRFAASVAQIEVLGPVKRTIVSGA